MRVKHSVSVVGLFVALFSMDIGTADAAMKRQLGASPSREQLMVYCRNQIFIKYGQWGRFGKRWLQREWVAMRVEHCAASGGKSI
jgi:hypothetical protein